MNSKSYHVVQQEDETEELGLILNTSKSKQNGGKISKRAVLLLSVALIVLPVLAIIFTQWPHIQHYHAHKSPLFKAGEITYHTQRFNGSFFKKTVFRNDAGPEVDAAWESLGVDYRPMLIPAEKARQAGLKYDQVQLSDKYGGCFIAYFFGIHQLHCLNLVRQALWFNYDYYVQKGEGAFINNATVLKTHVTHCLDMLRQQLVCNVDTDLLGEVWFYPSDRDVNGPRPFVDFNTEHRCRNFEVVRQYAQEHQVPEFAETYPDDYFHWPEPGYRIFNGTP